MGLMHAGLLLLLFFSVYSYQFRSDAGYGLSVQDPELHWKRMESVIDEEMSPGPAPKGLKSASSRRTPLPTAKSFPEYVRVPVSKYQTDVFKPEKGTRPLPDWVKEILLVPSSTDLANVPQAEIATAKSAARSDIVEMLCHIDRMYVRIRREVFGSRNAYKDLKLGNCPVNQGTKIHYYFLYLLKTDCGFKRESYPDYLSISNMLEYKPAGNILREMPFNVSLQCKYPRLFHSYKIGFRPKLRGATVFKALQPKQNVVLIALDASGNEITGKKTYMLGQPMYFEARKAKDTTMSGDQRMYINKCFMTASQYPNSNPKYTVISNQGCMTDGKMVEQSKFLSTASKMVQRFTVGAFIFKEPVSSSQQLYMHCEVSVGRLSPTSSSKACNYDLATKKWKELYGDDSVCTCCETSCPSALLRASSKTISSPSWWVDLSSKDGSVDVQPRTKLFDADPVSWEADMTEHIDFLNYWEDDY